MGVWVLVWGADVVVVVRHSVLVQVVWCSVDRGIDFFVVRLVCAVCSNGGFGVCFFGVLMN